MSQARMYALPVVVLVWAALVFLMNTPTELIVLRLVTFGVSSAVSIHELARRSGQRRE